LFLQPSYDLGSGCRCADAFGLLQALPQNFVIDKAPGVLHCLDQSAFIVSRRGAGLLVLDGRVLQSCGLAVAEGWQQLRVVALVVETAARTLADDRRLGNRDCTE